MPEPVLSRCLLHSLSAAAKKPSSLNAASQETAFEGKLLRPRSKLNQEQEGAKATATATTTTYKINHNKMQQQSQQQRHNSSNSKDEIQDNNDGHDNNNHNKTHNFNDNHNKSQCTSHIGQLMTRVLETLTHIISYYVDLLANSEILAGQLDVDALLEEVRLAGYPSHQARKSMANSTELLCAHHQDRLHEFYLGFKEQIQTQLASALQDIARSNMMKHVARCCSCKKNPMLLVACFLKENRM